ncbi:MAG: MarR family transcriptional regulator [Cyclobacteriaceae bacterium]
MEPREIGSFIDRTYKAVRQDLLNRFKEANLDLTPEQWVILSRLSDEGAQYQSELAHHSFRDKPTVSRIIDLLAKKGYVKRESTDDRRKWQINLTVGGEQLVNKAMPIVIASRERGCKDLSMLEYDALVVALDKIFNNYTQ